MFLDNVSKGNICFKILEFSLSWGKDQGSVYASRKVIKVALRIFLFASKAIFWLKSYCTSYH